MTKVSRNVDLFDQQNQIPNGGRTEQIEASPIVTRAKKFYCLEERSGSPVPEAAESENDEGVEGTNDESEEDEDLASGAQMTPLRANISSLHEARRPHQNHERPLFQQQQLHRRQGNNNFHYQHAPVCLASRPDVELASKSTRGQHEKSLCAQHGDYSLLRQNHKLTCAIHKIPMAMNNQRLYRGALGPQHAQLSFSSAGVRTLSDQLNARASAAAATNARDHSPQQRAHRAPRYSKLPANEKLLSLPAEHKGKQRRASHNSDAKLSINFRDFRLPRTFLPQSKPTGGDRDDQDSEDFGDFRKGAYASSSRRGRASERGHGAKRTRMKFISQLYFLIHLSAMISLLLHHKNLVSNERTIEPPMQLAADLLQAPTRRNSLASDNADQTNGRHQLRQAAAKTATALVNNGSSFFGQPPVLPTPQTARFGDLGARVEFQPPRGALLASAYGRFARNPPQPPTSAPSQAPRPQLGGQPRRATRSPFSSAEAQMDSKSADILVRLVGRHHARSALQYLLSYLLSSSVTILIALWLVRVCDAAERPARRRRLERAASQQRVVAQVPAPSQAAAQSAAGRSLVATRQDCTPVLIGSISLGLIQLIVIGLDIADNIDWLSPASPFLDGENQAGRQWPIFLPLFQFLFVSLLMQFILAMTH